MKLYYSPGACSLSVHILLKELEIPFELERVNLRDKPPEFLKTSPKGSVPVLQLEEGEILTEAGVILQFLADQKPERGFISSGGRKRYHELEMVHYIATEIHKGMGLLFRVDRMVENPEGLQQLKTSAKEMMKPKFSYLEQKLAGKNFLNGESFGIADIYLFTTLNWHHLLGVDLTPWPGLMSFFERVRSRPAVYAAMKAEGLVK